MQASAPTWLGLKKGVAFRSCCRVLVASCVAATLAYTLGVQHGQRIAASPTSRTLVFRVNDNKTSMGERTTSRAIPNVMSLARKPPITGDEKLPPINPSVNFANATANADTSCRIRDVLPHVLDDGKPFKMSCGGKQEFGPPVPSHERRFAILVRGESFRGLTGMYDRSIDVTKATFQCQKRASDSHVNSIIKPLESCGYKVDVFIRTWRAHDKHWGANSRQQLIEMYAGRVVASQFDDHVKYEHGPVTTKKHPQAFNFESGLLMIANYSKNKLISYDAILVIRSDLTFKRPLGNVAYDKVMFAFREWLLIGGAMVADTIHYFPWKYANCAVIEGFREHWSGSMGDRIGTSNLDFLVKERHDSNSMADRNPLYQMCRPEQKYEMDGGFPIMLFGIESVTKRDVLNSGSSVRDALFSQGEPRALPACDIVCHFWIPDLGRKRALETLVHFSFGQAPAARDFEYFPLQKVPNVTKTSGWASGFMSLFHVSRRVMKTDVSKARQRSAKILHRMDYAYDRLVYVRLGYKFLTNFINIFECDTAAHICVGYGSEKYPTVPVIIIASQAACNNFNTNSTEFLYLVNGTHVQARRFLEMAFGFPTHVICQKC